MKAQTFIFKQAPDVSPIYNTSENICLIFSATALQME